MLRSWVIPGQAVAHSGLPEDPAAHERLQHFDGAMIISRVEPEVATANAPGVRRTRWLATDFTLTREIYDTGPRFPDAVRDGVPPRNVDVRAVQEALREQGVNLIQP